MSQHTNQSWGGRFSEPTDAFVEQFTASVNFDRRLYHHDIRGSIAHATMLARVDVLTLDERDAIIQGLSEVEREIETGEFPWSVALEDVHMNIEARLTEKIGITGKKLHTGRSRNDQIATDIRLYLRDEIDAVSAELGRLREGLIELAAGEADTIMPGFTHLQTAQPVTFGHHLLAWFEMLKRDRERLLDCRKRVNRLPLGAAALGFYALGSPLAVLHIDIYQLADSVVLMALPLFTFAGFLLSESRTADRLMRLSQAAFGWCSSAFRTKSSKEMQRSSRLQSTNST